jgi:hypothetical protein
MTKIAHDRAVFYFVYVVLILALLALSAANRVLFHSLAELFTSFIAFTIFVLTWHTRAQIENEYLLYLGIPFLFVGGLTILHVLSFESVNVLTAGTTNVSTQVVLVADLFESSAFVMASLLSGPFIDRLRGRPRSRSLRLGVCFGLYALAAVTLLGLMFGWSEFPGVCSDGSPGAPCEDGDDCDSGECDALLGTCR